MVKEFADKQRDRSQVFSLPNLVPTAREPGPGVSLAPRRFRTVGRRRLSQSVQTPPRGGCVYEILNAATSNSLSSQQYVTRCHAQSRQRSVRCHQDNGALSPQQQFERSLHGDSSCSRIYCNHTYTCTHMHILHAHTKCGNIIYQHSC